MSNILTPYLICKIVFICLVRYILNEPCWVGIVWNPYRMIIFRCIICILGVVLRICHMLLHAMHCALQRREEHAAVRGAMCKAKMPGKRLEITHGPRRARRKCAYRQGEQAYTASNTPPHAPNHELRRGLRSTMRFANAIAHAPCRCETANARATLSDKPTPLPRTR